jgi:hypothetical protein
MTVRLLVLVVVLAIGAIAVAASEEGQSGSPAKQAAILSQVATRYDRCEHCGCLPVVAHRASIVLRRSAARS